MDQVRACGWGRRACVIGIAATFGAWGCAEASDSGLQPAVTTSTGSGSTSVESPSTGEPTTGISGTSTSTSGGSTTDETTSGGSSTGTVDDGTSTGAMAGSSSGGMELCANQETCTTGMVLGMVSGDEASDDLLFQDAFPTWVSFFVSEDNESVVGEELAVTITLTSPADFDFDLYVYRGDSDAANGCEGALSMSTASEGDDVVNLSWGEGSVANGGDDGSWIAVEVVSKDGTCDENASWTLYVDGDT